MKHLIVFSLHDTSGIIINLIKKIAPTLEEIFDEAVVSITPKTDATQKVKVEELRKNNFFKLCQNEPETVMGDHYMKAIKTAIERSRDEDLIHICNPDRLAVAILTHKNDFLKDMEEERKEEGPILYERSDFAWSTHPKNYRAIESMATALGKILLGKELDFFWCDFTVKAGLLKTIAEKIKTSDFRILAELMWPVRDDLVTKKVDWLEWEDPFVFGREPVEFKKEREMSEEEDQKRMEYVVETINWLLEASKTKRD